MRQEEGSGGDTADSHTRQRLRRRARNTTPARQTPARTTARPAAITTAQAPRSPNAATRARIDELLARIQDAYFDYDKHALRPDAMKTLEGDSKELRDILAGYPDYKLTVEGYCDERGSAEYNLALGDARAKAAKDYLVGVGIPSQTTVTGELWQGASGMRRAQ